MNTNDISSRFYEFDKRGVRPFVRYSEANGCWKIECYRKMTDKERIEYYLKKKKQDDGSAWEMIREGHIQTYTSRQEAELNVLELAEKICKENGY